MAKGRPKASPEQIEIDERQISALNLRKAGATYQQIADELGYAGPSGAENAVRSALSKARSGPAEELRELELSRLDEMQTGLWEAALSGDADAVNGVLRIMGHRARLTGMERKDAPIRIKDFPKIQSSDNAVQAISLLIERAADGELALSDAISMATLVNKHFETLEGAELLERLKRLEEQYESESKHD